MQPTDLPRTLPLAIAAGLLALVLAPAVGGGEGEDCTPSGGVVAAAEGPSMMRTATSDPGDGEDC